MLKWVYLTFLLTLSCQPAIAEVFKCKTPQGKTVYSESPCEGMSSTRVEIIDNALDSNHLRWEAYRNQVERAQGRMRPEQEEVEYMSDHDKQKRISENMISANAATASEEKRVDAQYENHILQTSQVRALSYDNNRNRANLKVDLNSLDQVKRYKAAAELRNLYQNY